MKLIIFLGVIFIPVLARCQQQAFIIQGEVSNRNGKVYLRYNKGNQTVITHDAPVISGKFLLKGTIDAPYKAYLTIKYSDSLKGANSDRLEFFLDTGVTIIRTRGAFDKATITGTSLCRDAAEYQEPMNALYAQLEKAYEAKEKFASAEEKSNLTYQKALVALDDSFLVHQKQLNVNFIKEHPESRLNLYIFREQSYFFDYKELEPLFKRLSPAIRNSPAGIAYGIRLDRLKAVAVGQLAPDFSHPDTSGTMVRLSSFRGNYVLLDFWASWCGPCRAENPYLKAAYEQYKNKRFTIVGLSLDKKAYHKLWRQAITRDKLYWTQLSDGSENNPVVQLYGVKGIPQNFLIDPQGKIIAHNLRGSALEEILAQLITY